MICIISDEAISSKTVSNIVEATSRGAKSIIIKPENIFVDKNSYDYLIEVPSNTEFLQPLLIIVGAQLLAYEIAVLRKCDIDKPKNLAKSVTVE